MKTTIYPVILAGGSGTRLWPLSRQNFPKQFLTLHGELSLLQQTAQRVRHLNSQQCLVVSNDSHYFLCQEQLADYPLQVTYLLEPCSKNTAAAIASAAHYLAHHVGPDALMLILPSDHHIADNTVWNKAIEVAALYASTNEVIITFGIEPDSPKTGYGYIESGEALNDRVHRVAHFKEKPSLAIAEQYITQGNYYWNSGMFLCRADVLLSELQQHEPTIYEFTRQAYLRASSHSDFVRLHSDYFSQCRSESIDYAIMEKTDKAVLIPITLQWSDLGCWTAVAENNPQDSQGNTLIGSVIAQDTQDCLIHSEHRLVTTIGIQDQIIIATNDAVLVADKRYSQQVKELVDELRQAHPQLTEDHPRVFRPWGYYDILAEGPAFKVKRIMIKPGAKLSLQMHEHRAEHWVVVSGEAEVINDDRLFRLSVNQSTYIPKKTRHRLSNPGHEPLFIIEVQSGAYLGEDDIKRFDDIYFRAVENTV